MGRNKKKIRRTAAAAVTPLLLLAGEAAFFYLFSVDRFPERKMEKTERQLRREERKRAKKPRARFEKTVQEGVSWFLGQEPELVSITSYDGLKLCAYYLPAEGTRKERAEVSENSADAGEKASTAKERKAFAAAGSGEAAHPAKNILLLIHGYRAGGLTDFAGLYRFSHEQGYDLLVPFQRSHGPSEGKYICFGVKERYDCRDWAEYAVRLAGKNCNLYLSGISMGCATVLMAAGLPLPSNVRAIIADCGFTSPKEILKTVLKRDYHLPAFPLMNLTELLTRWRAGFGYSDASTLDAMKNCRIPVLFIHGEKDSFVPVQMTLDNYMACRAPKELLIVPGAVHAAASLQDPEGYQRAVLTFMKKYERS